MREIKKIPTSTYSLPLTEQVGKEIYIKATVVERITYGEYVGEPGNGMLLKFTGENGHSETTVVNLDDHQVYIEAE